MPTFRFVIAAGLLVVLLPGSALAYIGPGAGFALAGSFLAVFGAIFSALSMIVFWPVRRLIRFLLRRRPPGRIRFRRVVILGLDGLDYDLTQKFLDEGKLPHLAALRDQGDFRPLRSTLPPISPVAWSSFQTGVNPGKHNIFDFLIPDPRTYQPKLSSVEIRTARRGIGWGPFRWIRRIAHEMTSPIRRPSFNGKPKATRDVSKQSRLRLAVKRGHCFVSVPTRSDVRLLRKSQPFWSVLSRYGIFNSILRVPITFPPEKLRGVQLSAMCVPDLRGTQGTFAKYTSREPDGTEKTGGEVHQVQFNGRQIRGQLLGPPHPDDPRRGPLKLPFIVTITGDGRATLKIAGKTHVLEQGIYSPWVHVRFRAGRSRSIHGVCRFLLLTTHPEFELYVTPLNIDPERPAMTIGYPAVYPIYLAKRQGPYATLGLAEDTWGLSEQVLEDEHFLQQCLDIEREREAMFFDSLEKVPRGLCVCVFDGSDRMQHMFWRYWDQLHPARPAVVPDAFRTAIEDLYVRMDQLVGRTMARCRRNGTLLMVLSDHGFNTFRRGVDLNRWLEENGYLVVDDARRGQEHLAGVDWQQTRAFAIGLTGIFLNLKGRFEHGIVPPGDEAARLRDEIQQRLAGLTDPDNGQPAFQRIYQAAKVYRGPYTDQAPDLIVGYASGYRVAWDTAVGRTARQVFHDNTKAWSGDHCVDPSVVPGVLFCNHQIAEQQPRLLDIAPTVLQLFGIPAPDYMDGCALTVGGSSELSAKRSVKHDVRQPQVIR